MSKISPAATAAIQGFLDAQSALLSATVAAQTAEEGRLCAFVASAIAASDARRARVTLQKLADANKAATAHIASTAPKGTLYVSLASVTVHAFTGDVLRLPDADGDDVKPVNPIALQALVSKLYKHKDAGTSAIKVAIGGAKTRQDGLERLESALESANQATDTSAAAGNGDNDDEDGEIGDMQPGESVESLLSRVIEMIGDGTELTESARELIGQLVDTLRPARLAA